MLEADAILTAGGNDLWLSLRRLALADVHRRHGAGAAAQNALDEADLFIARSGERVVEAELHRMRGELALDTGDRSGAAHRFTQP